MSGLIPASQMPCPRLELRWIKTGDTWTERECAYSIVIPLAEHDIRREDKEGNKVRRELTVEIGRTRVTGGMGDEPIWDGKKVDTPYRDGAHALWDAEHLHLPVYAVCGDSAMLFLSRTASQAAEERKS